MNPVPDGKSSAAQPHRVDHSATSKCAGMAHGGGMAQPTRVSKSAESHAAAVSLTPAHAAVSTAAAATATATVSATTAAMSPAAAMPSRRAQGRTDSDHRHGQCDHHLTHHTTPLFATTRTPAETKFASPRYIEECSAHRFRAENTAVPCLHNHDGRSTLESQ
jgi:hypothetical protein